MRSVRLLLIILVLFAAFVPHAPAQSASQAGPPYRGIWSPIAPHIDVRFSQVGRNSCTWHFRNTDDVHTLQSMRFSFRYSAILGAQSSTSLPPGRASEDMLYGSLGPGEESGTEQNYEVPANCATVTIRVIDAKWI